MISHTGALFFIAYIGLSLVSCGDGLSVRTDMQEPGRDAASLARQRILVTFIDSSIGRVPLNQAETYYRQRTGYQSSTWSRRMSARLADDYELVEVDGWPIAGLGIHCVVFEIAARQSIDEVIEKLSHDKRVESVQRMHLFRVLSDPYYRLQKGLQLMQISEAHRWVTGRNITVAMIDTGVDFDHPDLKGQVADSEDLVTDDPSAFIDDIHGTAVAGVIAAVADNGVGIVGVAPNSKLDALKACWPELHNAPAAVCNSLTLAKALGRVIALKPNILNLSLTGPRDPLLTRLLHKAIEKGVVVVAADPGVTSHYDDSFPASVDSVIAVHAASTQNRIDQDTYASRLIAPGSDILTTFPHGLYNFLSGSSFAAAHVSGVVALLLELNPALSAAEIKKILQPTNNEVDSPSRLENPKIVNACAAIARLRHSVRCDAAVAERVKSKNAAR
jgi:hypothetical protein